MEGSAPLVWRRATEQDTAFLRELHDLNRPEFSSLPDPLRQSLLDMQYRAREAGYCAQYPQAKRQVLLWQGQAVGQMLLAEDRLAVILVDFAVLPACQGQGRGSAALRLLQAYAGARPIYLQVAQHSPALRLYTRLGFQATEHDDLNIQMTWQAPAGPASLKGSSLDADPPGDACRGPS